MKDTDIQNEFRKTKRQHTSNAQSEPEIDYVIWLEQELIKARMQVNKNESISLVSMRDLYGELREMGFNSELADKIAGWVKTL